MPPRLVEKEPERRQKQEDRITVVDESLARRRQAQNALHCVGDGRRILPARPCSIKATALTPISLQSMLSCPLARSLTELAYEASPFPYCRSR
jgi:hypothetical protein